MGKNYQQQLNAMGLKIDKLAESMAKKEYNGDTVYGDVQTLIAGYRLYQEVLTMVNKNTQQQMAQVEPAMREGKYMMRYIQSIEHTDAYQVWKADEIKTEAEAQAKVNAEAEKRMKEKKDGEEATTPTPPDNQGDQPTNEGKDNKQPDPDPR